MPAETAPRPPVPVAAIPSNARMMPMTVAKRPMNGAVVAIVARPPSPFFMSAVVMRADRSMARSAAATVSCPTTVPCSP
jgi:hypothetical protein